MSRGSGRPWKVKQDVRLGVLGLDGALYDYESHEWTSKHNRAVRHEYSWALIVRYVQFQLS